ncbi:IucA/IucC family protein [Streptomyces sp. H27-C3]|uniref:IucA/IucC family protein n=1 Tax=Streptomyces sp. H27-C3 TaxID=3046305 RepID=UPI0024BB41D1|nr:IucA/IucC family protein [Streptomyces sp. H27-C3]MDJ0464321.1 IucA/IucC family protein [Streptomyces sp. H27-C3]
MNPTSASDASAADSRPTAHDRGQGAPGTHSGLAVDQPTVPRQGGEGRGGQRPARPDARPDTADPCRPDTADPCRPDTADPCRPDTADPCRPDTADPCRPDVPDLLDHPDPHTAAEAAAVENLLRCWVRENGLARPAGPSLRIPLDASAGALLVPVRYWSATGWHRFGLPDLEGAPQGAPPADAVTLAALLGREASRGEDVPGEGGLCGGAELVGRVADSVRRTADFIADRRHRPQPAGHEDLFLTAEQSLFLGHPLHPTPKSREGLSESETRLYSPELRGSFPLHWMAVDRSVLAQDSAWTERGRTVTAGRLTARLADGLQLPDNTVPLPLHPWQARDLSHRPGVTALLDAGLLHDLGPYGEHWHPTSSIRTVHRPGAAAMLKLSLGVRITNSRRENLRKELHRGVEVQRLLRGGLSAQWRAAHPAFDIVRDPAWLAVDATDGVPVPGLDVLLRHNPFGPGDDAVCVAALTAPRPWPGRTGMRSRLAHIVAGLAARTGRSTGAVAAEWFLRYLDHVVRPILWLDGFAGIALEAHQQNTLVLLDTDGWPIGGRYRDNQGYYFRESRRAALEQRLPGIGATSDTFVTDAVADERFAYYLGINNILGLIGAFGAQRLAEESVLIAALRQFLGKNTALGSSLPAHLLETPGLRCKANLLTRLHGLDELVGPVDTQSVYVTVANPLRT